jgi:alpha-L-arabinofuranosidase
VLNAVESVDKIKADFLELIDDCHRHGFKPRLALSEWNYWLHASHWDGKRFFEPDDAQHGLFVSGMFHMMARLAPYIEVAAYSQLANAMGLVSSRGGEAVVSAISELFQLYRPAFPGEVVELDVSTGDLQEGIPQVDALALRQDGVLWVFISNRSHDKATPLSIDGVSFAECEARLFSAEDYQSPMLERLTPCSNEGWELPPLSLLRLCCRD